MESLHKRISDMKSSPEDIRRLSANEGHASNSSGGAVVATASPVRSVREWAEMIKLEHTVFALPFALSGLLLSLPGGTLPSLATVCWTILAFTGARAAAMTLNRIIDSEIDGQNPRTSDRALPAGRIKLTSATTFTFVSFGLMLLAASQLPPICLWLSPIALFWLSFYSYTKRFTWLCHLVLGIALGGAALGGWVAASGSITGAAPWLLSGAVACWVAGFDIIYACQDVAFDRGKRLFSIPARFGVGAALTISRVMHVITLSCLIGLGLSLHLGYIYALGAGIVALMLAYEHSLVSADDLSKVNAAFFTTNGVVSILTFLCILADKLVRF
jgi:4-hydroxybenzoate polyprenyltransferase